MSLYPSLRVTSWLNNTEEEDVKKSDFTTFLTKQSPQYVKGRKVSSDYTDPVTDDLVARKTFSDVLLTGNIVGMDILIEWFDGTDTAILSKTIYKPLNKAEVETMQRTRRHRAIDYLKANAYGTPVEPAIGAIMTHYEATIESWYMLGDDSLGDAIAAEADATINGYLDIVLLPSDNPDPANIPTYDVRSAILFQIDYPYVSWP